MRTFAILSGFLILLIALLFVVVRKNSSYSRTSQEIHSGGGHGTEIKSVFVNVKGDSRLNHRLGILLGFELEDAQIRLATSESGADAIVNGEVQAQVDKHNLGLGVVRMLVTANGKTKNLSFCASLGSDEDNQTLFNGAATSTGESLRTKYPNSSTIRMDLKSNMTRSQTFSDELARSLRNSNFKIVDKPSTDITLLMDLVVEKVPVEEDLVHHEIVVVSKDGTQLYTSNGNGVLSAKLVGPPPAQCPDRFSDLDWLSDNNPLAVIARNVTKFIKKQGSGSVSRQQESSK